VENVFPFVDFKKIRNRNSIVRSSVSPSFIQTEKKVENKAKGHLLPIVGHKF